MIQAFRLCKSKHVSTAFTGEGARLNGGRWNSPAVAMVYTSGSLSLATLEILVHLEDSAVFARWFSWMPVAIPEIHLEYLDLSTLAARWNDDELNISSRSVGDTWIRSSRSAALAVPSVVTPGEWNYLLNPAHPGFREIQIGEARKFQPDPRLCS